MYNMNRCTCNPTNCMFFQKKYVVSLHYGFPKKKIRPVPWATQNSDQGWGANVPMIFLLYPVAICHCITRNVTIIFYSHCVSMITQYYISIMSPYHLSTISIIYISSYPLGYQYHLLYDCGSKPWHPDLSEIVGIPPKYAYRVSLIVGFDPSSMWSWVVEVWSSKYGLILAAGVQESSRKQILLTSGHHVRTALPCTWDFHGIECDFIVINRDLGILMGITLW